MSLQMEGSRTKHQTTPSRKRTKRCCVTERFRPERFLEEDVDMKGQDYRLLPFGAGRRVCPGAQLRINLVTSMIGHLPYHFDWAAPSGQEEIDMGENPGMVTYTMTLLEVILMPRLSDAKLYKRVAVDDV